MALKLNKGSSASRVLKTDVCKTCANNFTANVWHASFGGNVPFKPFMEPVNVWLRLLWGFQMLQTCVGRRTNWLCWRRTNFEGHDHLLCCSGFYNTNQILSIYFLLTRTTCATQHLRRNSPHCPGNLCLKLRSCEVSVNKPPLGCARLQRLGHEASPMPFTRRRAAGGGRRAARGKEAPLNQPALHGHSTGP
jgi:hypothetical protein